MNELVCVWQLIGPLAEVNFGPSGEVRWRGSWVGEAMSLALERSGSPKSMEAVDQPIDLLLLFSIVRRNR